MDKEAARPEQVPSIAVGEPDLSFLGPSQDAFKPQAAEVHFSAQAPVVGCRYSSLAQARAQNPREFELRLFKLMRNRESILEKLHLRHAQDGLYLFLEKDTNCPLPLRMETHMDAREPGAGSFAHHLFILEPGAQATLVEELKGKGSAPAFIHGACEIFLGENTRLDYILFQDLPAPVRSFGRIYARLSAGSVLNIFHIELGAFRRRLDLECNSVGVGARALLDGVFAGRGNQTLDVSISMNHFAQAAESDMLWKAALSDQSRFGFLGSVYIAPPAVKSRAFQAVHSLLLSSKAQASPDPRLEILADDVMAKHAATIGNLDEEARFYLMSRGVSPAAADRMLTAGFLSEAIKRLRPEIHKEAQLRLEEKLGAALR